MNLADDRETLELVATSIEYPETNSAAAARAAGLRLQSMYPTVAARFTELADWLDKTSMDELEEVYSALFDLRPACTLHVGYHVYGEAYQRGGLLAGLAEELRKAGVNPGNEIPDYLPTVLRLLSRLPNDENRQLFIDNVLALGLGLMTRELKNVNTPWAAAVASMSELFVAPPSLIDDSLEGRIQREKTSHA